MNWIKAPRGIFNLAQFLRLEVADDWELTHYAPSGAVRYHVVGRVINSPPNYYSILADFDSRADAESYLDKILKGELE